MNSYEITMVKIRLLLQYIIQFKVNPVIGFYCVEKEKVCLPRRIMEAYWAVLEIPLR